MSAPRPESVIVATLADLRSIVAEELGRGVAFLAERIEARSDAAPLGMMTADEVAATLKITTRELRRLVHEGGFPAPLKLGKRRIRWPASVVGAAVKGTL